MKRGHLRLVATDPLDPAVREALHRAYLNRPALHNKAFSAWLADPALRGCLRNLAEIDAGKPPVRYARAANDQRPPLTLVP